MRIIMHVAGMPFDGNTINEGKSLGGSETAGYYVARELAKRGHSVTVFCNIPDGQSKKIDGVIYMPLGEVNQQNPFGLEFLRHAQLIPSDVILAQRMAGIFNMKYASKLNLFWTHDLALKRAEGAIHSQLWNTDKVLCVSNFHKKQVQEVYGIHERVLEVLPNGIDHQLIEPIDAIIKKSSQYMLYSSRPERGLENLVREGGIMEKLLKVKPGLKLIVCTYDNFAPQMQSFYDMLFNRCKALPNVDLYPPQSKQNLMQIMKNAWLQIYPTAFEEVSCITAMEAQANGTPFMTTKTGALPETLDNAGVVWVKDLEPDSFVKAICKLQYNPERWDELSAKALKKSKEYDWKLSVDRLEKIITEAFEEKTKNADTLISHFVDHSDIFIASSQIAKEETRYEKQKDFIEKTYGFAFSGSTKKHYDEVADYNINQIKNTHLLGFDNAQLSMPRNQFVIERLKEMKDGARVLDVGCCVGQCTIAFARAFPKLQFTGVDISQAQIEIANKYAKENHVENITYYQVTELNEILGTFDLVIANEILEHIPDYPKFLETIENHILAEGGVLSLSTPSGPMERNRWNRQLTREHLHHFEEQDILDIYSHKKDFQFTYAYAELNREHEPLGSFCYSFRKDEASKGFKPIQIERKLKVQSPVQTLSVCIISTSDGDSLAKTLRSVSSIAKEIIIGIDGIKGRAWDIAEDFGAIAFPIESPLIIGFDEARNQTIEKSTGDWILWIDSDEILEFPDKILKYLRQNQYDGYAIHQHHFSVEPVGLLKTDLPTRIFRNREGIKFYGVVHEHPEKELNEGPGHVLLIPSNDCAISHNGYNTEETRRKRFARNFPLMQRDRQKYPKRNLGHFLWIRDLMHQNRFSNTQFLTQEIANRCNEALELWRWLIKNNQVRIATDCIPYITEATKMLTNGGGIDFDFSFGAHFMGIGDKINGNPINRVQGTFFTEEDIKLYSSMMLKAKLDLFSGKYL